MGKRASGKTKQIKREVAAEAARIMATEGQRNYLSAKQKAASRLGISSSLALPSNTEVELALKSYLSLYGGEQQRGHLLHLRKTALDAMSFFSGFKPRLVGPVLEGTADRHSRVSLHLFCDSPDELVLFLGEEGIAYKEEERRIRWYKAEYRQLPIFVTDANGVAVELCVFESKDIRQPPPSPVDGKPQRRASRREVALLLERPLENSPLTVPAPQSY